MIKMSDSPTETSLPTTQASLPARFLLVVILIVVLSLWVFYLLMRPPLTDLGYMVLYLSTTAVISLLASYATYRLGWIYRSPTIRWTLLGGYALSSLLTFLNVGMTAYLMFTSPHDLLLATVLLLFAGGIATTMGYFLSTAITDRIRLLDQAARSIAKGDLQVQTPASGRDEIAELGSSFNHMADQLQVAARKQQELENLRRDLIAWVSHDLQTPLASIRAIVEALADGVVSDPETVQRYLHTAQKDIGDLSSLIDNLFQMAQLDAGGLPLEVESASLSDLISDTLEGFTALSKQKQVNLSGAVQPGLDPVRMDSQLIGRVLDNLVGNALRYTPTGGWVELHAEVIDSGEGVQPEDLPRIFERFYKGEKSRNRATGGSGLGLAISRGIIEAHGGIIGVESKPDAGACFYFTIPTT
jgi:signal transduction histidine kinase